MAAVKFTATHGVMFQDDDGVWAHFVPDTTSDELVDGVAERRYVFETEDDKVAARLRKVDDYGIAEVKRPAGRPRKSTDSDPD